MILPIACIECVLSGFLVGALGTVILIRKGATRWVKTLWIERCLTQTRLKLAAARDNEKWREIAALEEDIDYLNAKLAALKDPGAVW